jgi:large subunit ribosomal protein L6
MSRVGKSPVAIPSGVDIVIEQGMLSAKGSLGTNKMVVHALVKVVKEGEQLLFSPANGSREANALTGTTRALAANLVTGVSKGFEKKLSLVGVGYKAQANADSINLTLGFSHPVVHKMPAGVKVETPTPTEILVKGFDRQAVGEVAAKIRAYRPPEPYKGKGVRYSDEVVIIKETKKK